MCFLRAVLAAALSRGRLQAILNLSKSNQYDLGSMKLVICGFNPKPSF
jgi:hypothetical protein